MFVARFLIRKSAQNVPFLHVRAFQRISKLPLPHWRDSSFFFFWNSAYSPLSLLCTCPLWLSSIFIQKLINFPFPKFFTATHVSRCKILHVQRTQNNYSDKFVTKKKKNNCSLLKQLNPRRIWSVEVVGKRGVTEILGQVKAGRLLNTH